MAVAGYILCATPRSGSTLLCDLLIATGVAGHPKSFYRRESIADWAKGHDCPSDEGPDFDRTYVAAVRRDGSRDTGLFGLRLMWYSLADLSARLSLLFPAASSDRARLEAAFGNLLYVHLSRQDTIAQAVSRLKAEQTGLWHRAADGSERERVKPPEPQSYDPVRLAAFVDEAEAANAAWERWFTAEGITPFRLRYEDLSADPRTALATILSALGRDPQLARTVEVRTAKLADAESLDWAARFAAD